ncbi:MAG: alpha/beta fold hydrolase [Chryseotalea sp.]
MRKTILFILVWLWTAEVQAQKEVEQDWNAFAQSIDVTLYQGGQFRFSGFVRTENSSKISNARLWARIDKKKGMGFFDNMHNRPISSDNWQKYSIEGPVDRNALKLIIGGLYGGSGRYYYDNFTLQLKKSEGEWENVTLNNPSFENNSYDTDWKSFYKVKGYEQYLSNDNVVDGSACLVIDCSGRKGSGKFIEVNGINIYYEEHGKGDTLLLLHGNSQSVKSFSNQIPELSKYFFVIAMDSQGQGNSSKDDRRMSYELMAEDVNSFLESKKIRTTNILGWSDGGNIGLILAMKHPDKIKRLATMGANLFNDKTSVDEKINKELRTQKEKLVKEDAERNKFEIEMIDLLLNEPKSIQMTLKRFNAQL